MIMNIIFLLLRLLVMIICGSMAMVMINEINSDDPTKPEKKEFVELIAYDTPVGTTSKIQLQDYSLRGYKIVVLSAYQKGSKGPTIELVANLWNSRIINGFFVFGGTDVNPNLKVDSPLVTFRRKFTGTPTLFGFFSNANIHPHAVFLLYKADGLPQLKLTQGTPYIKVNDEIKQLLKDTVVDVVVYGRRSAAEHCNIFEDIVPSLSNRNYVLREFDIPANSGSDYSLNRCTLETTPIMPEKFKLGKLTPGADNDCTGTRFILENNIIAATATVRKHYRDNIQEEAMAVAQCTSHLDPDIYYSVKSQKVDQMIQTDIDLQKMNDICTIINAPDDLSMQGTNEQRVRAADKAAAKMTSNVPEREWESMAYFNSDWLRQIELHQGNILPKKTIEQNRVWFEYLPNAQDPTQSQYQCRLCHKYYDKLGLDNRYRPALANPTLKSSYKLNHQKILEHSGLSQHQIVIAKLQEKAKNELSQQFQEIQRQNELEEKGQNAVTMKMIRTVYIETKINLPFMSHPKVVQLQEANGIFLGYHHYDRMSASRIVTSISMQMHDALLQHLVEKQSPVSLIVDSSTDSAQKHYLITYFQALEFNIPVVYFYKLIELKADESANGLLQALLEEWGKEKHGFARHLKVNLRGFASDGASVMVGKFNGLKKLLSDWASNSIFGIHCMAHRLHLAIRVAIESVTYFTDFESIVNSLHNFYNRHGHKRKAHLRALASVLEISMQELTYIFETRWISSELSALKSINNTWYLVVTDLDAISIDQNFNDLTRNEANGLSQKLKNKNFLLALQFLCDVLLMLSHWSKRLQQRSGVLIGAEEYRDNMIDTFENMKLMDGSFLGYYLTNVVCSESLTARKCTLDNYDRSVSIRWQTIELKPAHRTPKLENYRSQFLQVIIDQIKSYFPEGDLKSFDVFVPQKIPKKEAQVLFYGLGDIQTLAAKFSIDPQAATNEWTQALVKIVSTEEFCRFQSVQAIHFWQHYLNSASVVWGENITKLIKLVLVLPMGSADAERGFSVMNHIRTSRRSRLQGSKLDDLLRLRINGPNEIEKFNAAKYVKFWLSENHLRTDDPTAQKKKRPNEIELEESDKEDFVYLPSSTLF